MNKPFLIFAAVLAVVLGAINYAVLRRITAVLRLTKPGQQRLGIVLGLSLVLAFVARAVAENTPDGWATTVAVVFTTVQLAVVMAFALSLPLELCAGLQLLWRKVRSRTPVKSVPPPDTSPAATPTTPDTGTRRDFLWRASAGSVVLLGSSAAAYGALFGRHDYQLRQVAFAIQGLPRDLDGYRLVQLSDIHFGPFVGEAERRSAVHLVRQARADAVVLTGDLIDHNPAFVPLLGRLVRQLGELVPDGVFAIPGNHDYYTGVDLVLATLRQAGATTLVNSHGWLGDRQRPGQAARTHGKRSALGRIALIGVDDVWAPRIRPGTGPDLTQALRAVPADSAKVLLCHNPEFFPEAAGKVDLQLSGHTHGGQVNFGIRPADYVLRHGYVAGAYSRSRSQLYVNCGFGTAGPPARVGAPPEVTVVTLSTRA